MSVDTKLYDILGVSPTATDRGLRRAYQDKARQLHPGHNPHPDPPEKFRLVSEAYDILKYPELRRIYDQFGLEGLRRQNNSNLYESLNSIFGTPKRLRDIKHRLHVTLEELYNGKEITLRVTRKVLCPACDGSGYQKVKSAGKCRTCDGRGQRIEVTRAGPMITQKAVECSDCGGAGEKSEPCRDCNGQKVLDEKKTIVMRIEPGMENGEIVRFQGCGDEAKGEESGDFVVELQQKEHLQFVRKNDDLLVVKKIKLWEALLGVSFIVTHLDGRKLIVESAVGEVIGPDVVKVIEGEGMPRRGCGSEKGKLFVKFDVEFPKGEELTVEMRNVFKEAFGVTDEASRIDTEDGVRVIMEEGDMKEFGRASRENRREASSSQEYEAERETSQCQPI
jgi:DnaJ-class molecular chaperone